MSADGRARVFELLSSLEVGSEQSLMQLEALKEEVLPNHRACEAAAHREHLRASLRAALCPKEGSVVDLVEVLLG